jgi:NitT/TauT family transport system substrate-binding protein
MKLRLVENFRAVFYAPFYALKALDLAASVGLELDWLSSNTPGGAIDDVKAGRVDLTWGGPMRVIKDHDSTPADGASLVCFGEVVGRDPFCLVGRGDPAGFDLRVLPALHLGVVAEVPTPWYCLQADLRDLGIDLAHGGHAITDLSMPQQVQALSDGELDVAQLFEPYISQALAEGAGQVLYAAAERGPTVYTTFICSRDGLARHGAAFAALSRALQALQEWMAASGPRELARVTAPFFPDIPAQLFDTAVDHYWRRGVWSRHPQVSRAGFDRLAYSLHTGGFVGARMDYDACVCNFDDLP